ncbi:hypothetical protein JTE90_007776 [Oedothorax gibbosus]|uniref:Uncharacterized protein n=1 Tax=Oedothorax gibbosus TaxID=931172 RepID=A0AAV6TRD8_9ARAC|nr:hypothetical protein JTE90_007776 [Oedothorax gibbosus]
MKEKEMLLLICSEEVPPQNDGLGKKKIKVEIKVLHEDGSLLGTDSARSPRCTFSQKHISSGILAEKLPNQLFRLVYPFYEMDALIKNILFVQKIK